MPSHPVMKNLLRTTSAAALLAALVPAQNHDEAMKALARANVVETHEGDLVAAEASYRALLADPARGAAHGEAALRLGSLLWRLDRRDDATPFLQRAAAAGGAIGTEAQRVLQGQGDSDQAAAERLTRARAVVARLVGLVRSRHQLSPADRPAIQDEAIERSIDDTIRELHFFGDAAAAAVVEQLRQERGATGPGAAPDADPVVRVLAERLWSLGTTPAQQYLAEVANDPWVEWRRTIVAPARLATDDLLLTAAAFLRDADPTGEVARVAAKVGARLPADTIVQLVADASPIVRAAAWTGLEDRWDETPVGEQERLVPRVAARLSAEVSSTEPRSREAARALLVAFLMRGPAAARRLAFQHFTALPANLSPGRWIKEPIGDEELQLLASAGRSLGECPRLGADDHGLQRTLHAIVKSHGPTWSTAGVDSLFELIELGYAQPLDPAKPVTRNERPWVDRLADVASTEQVGRAIRLTLQIADPADLLLRLAARPGHAAFFAAARTTLESALEGKATGWRVYEATRPDLPPNQISREARGLVRIAARSGADDAPAWLTSLVTRDPEFAEIVAYGLVALSIATDREPVRAGLRKLLADEASDRPTSTKARSMAFAELIRLGDAPAIDSFAGALRRGILDDVEHPRATSFAGPVLGLLGHSGNAWHRYDAPHLAKAWDAVLGSGSLLVVRQLESGKVDLPAVALPSALRRLPTLVSSTNLSTRFALAQKVTEPLRAVTAAEVTTNPELRAAIAAALRDANDDAVTMTVLARLAPAVAALFGTELRECVTNGRAGRVVAALQAAGLPVSDAEWAAALRSPDWRTALDAIPTNASGAVRGEVETMLRDPDDHRRAAACGALARWLSKDAVAPLLDALRDPTPQVRTAATDALQQIRFHAEQQGFWSKDRNAVDTSPAATAAKLLAQAMPDQGKEQRLLAIRSLATLGAAEALPHLIDWSKDRDADVAAAARQALDAIHSRTSERK